MSNNYWWERFVPTVNAVSTNTTAVKQFVAESFDDDDRLVTLSYEAQRLHEDTPSVRSILQAAWNLGYVQGHKDAKND